MQYQRYSQNKNQNNHSWFNTTNMEWHVQYKTYLHVCTFMTIYDGRVALIYTDIAKVS